METIIFANTNNYISKPSGLKKMDSLLPRPFRGVWNMVFEMWCMNSWRSWMTRQVDDDYNDQDESKSSGTARGSESSSYVTELKRSLPDSAG